ncbi:unnamed protein product [Amoebophrya sp. A25]|nr:unnamed protein product [Amoebophrya sp. A25]|eukprot:GSA25T00012699001.1
MLAAPFLMRVGTYMPPPPADGELRRVVEAKGGRVVVYVVVREAEKSFHDWVSNAPHGSYEVLGAFYQQDRAEELRNQRKIERDELIHCLPLTVTIAKEVVKKGSAFPEMVVALGETADDMSPRGRRYVTDVIPQRPLGQGGQTSTFASAKSAGATGNKPVLSTDTLAASVLGQNLLNVDLVIQMLRAGRKLNGSHLNPDVRRFKMDYAKERVGKRGE